MLREEAIAVVEATFAGWYPTLLRYAGRLTGHAGFAEDAVQDVFVRLYEELVAGREVANPRAWTLVVLRRDLSRRWKTHQATTSIEDLPHLPAAPAPSDDDLTRLLGILSPRESEILLLRLEGLKYDEIARELDISQNTVGTLLVRSMRKLREAVRQPSAPERRHSDADQKRGRNREPLQ